MKKQLLTILAAVGLGTAANAQVILTESFESATFPPAGWSIFNNGSGNDWALNDMDPTFASQGQQSMYYEYSSTDPADAWAFSPALNLTAGDSIVISFDYMALSMDYPESMKLTIGNGTTVADQTNILWDEVNVVNESFMTATAGYKVTSTGAFNFALNCYSQADMYVLFVDNIKVRKVLSHDLQMNAYNGVLRSCSFSNAEEITVNFTNISSSTETLTPVGYRINGGAVVAEAVTDPIPAGTSYTYSFGTTADFSTPGTYTVEIFSALLTDGDNSNDTTSFVVVSEASGLMLKSNMDTLAIPDNDSAGATSVIPFCGLPNMLGTNIAIKRLTIESIIHTYDDDLNLVLLSPAGDSLYLAANVGDSNADYPTVTFTDTAVTNIIVFDNDPITPGYYHTIDSAGFAKFNGQDPNGNWRLLIFDDAGADVGYLAGWTLEFENPVGIKELKSVKNLISVAPNPNTGKFTLSLNKTDEARIEMYSVAGALVKSFQLSGTQIIDASDLSKGMYFIKAFSANGMQTVKVIIE